MILWQRFLLLLQRQTMQWQDHTQGHTKCKERFLLLWLFSTTMLVGIIDWHWQRTLQKPCKVSCSTSSSRQEIKEWNSSHGKSCDSIHKILVCVHQIPWWGWHDVVVLVRGQQMEKTKGPKTTTLRGVDCGCVFLYCHYKTRQSLCVSFTSIY